MVEDLEIREVVEKIRYSGLSFSSRQVIYSRLINEVWNLDFQELKQCVGIDDAFDNVYCNINDFADEDESYIGC